MKTLAEYGINNPIALILENDINNDVEKCVANMVQARIQNPKLYAINAEDEKENLKLSVIQKLLKATSFVLPTDVVVEIEKHYQDYSIVVKAIIEREGVRYNLETKSIHASGEVQSLHTRYLIKTDLNKYENNGEEQKVKEIIKAKKVVDDLNMKIQGCNYQINKSIELIAKMEKAIVDGDYSSLENERVLENILWRLKYNQNQDVKESLEYKIKTENQNIAYHKEEIQKTENKIQKI